MRTGRWIALLMAVILIPAAACAEVSVSVEPAQPKAGEVAEVTVTAGEGAESVIYTLTAEDKKIFSGKEDSHFVTAFRPRKETEYLLEVTVLYGDKSRETASVTIPVRGKAEVQQGGDVVYSQKDGWWKDKSYSKKTNLEKAGCAIFTLSHVLQRLGFSGEDVMPDALGKTYSYCYTQGGTANERLLTRSGEVYGFTTEDELITSKAEIRDALRDGDYFSFSIVIGHIALISGLSDDGSKVRIVDSAPSATFERIKKGNVYYLDGNGEFVIAKTPEEIPGARWYFETAFCGGLEYYMDLDYVARRGVRPIRPAWMRLKADGAAAELVRPGTATCDVISGGEEKTVPTEELAWGSGTDGGKLAFINKKTGTKLKNAEGKNIRNVPACAVLPVLRSEEKRLYVIYNGIKGYISRGDAELTDPLPAQGIRSGVISYKGNTSGLTKVRVRYSGSAKGKVLDEWKTGTRVNVLAQKDGFYQIDGRGMRVWVQEDFLTVEDATDGNAEKE